MTAEIMIMNKLAVALAADSAATIAGNKVYQSANKLFQLVLSEPVGFMVYGNDEFMGIPWETVVSLYRSASEGKSFDRLVDYANDFIKFLREFPYLSITDEVVRVELAVDDLLKNFAQQVLQQSDPNNEPPSAQEVSLALASMLENRLQEIETYPLVAELPADFEKAVVRQCEPVIRDAVYRQFDELPDIDTLLTSFQRLVVGSLVRGRLLPDSGIVLAGYGRLDVLPAMAESQIFFRMLGEVAHTPVEMTALSLDYTAQIRPFAQTEMVNAFMEGIDPDLNQHMLRAMEAKFAELLATVMQRLDVQDENIARELQEISQGLLQNYLDEMKSYRLKGYIYPVMDAVAVLGKQDLAIMAETLVNLTAFKRRVSFDTESVGGDIDVAVISKIDGFVWVKRKQYAPNQLA